ncbi:MAG TPA: hypothetical protein VGO33_14810 [Gemmatimonadaceae bacterium]|nr:hypothetical protein [Gemmatimonadaceae bacterium]
MSENIKPELASSAEEDFDSESDDETIKLAYDESVALRPMYTSWFDGTDTKIVAIFIVASVIVTFAPGISKMPPLSGDSHNLWIAAILFWLVAVVLCYAAYNPRAFRIDPNPGKIRKATWLRLTPSQYRFYRLRDMGKTHDLNLDQIQRKTMLLRWAMFFTAVEVLALVAAFV